MSYEVDPLSVRTSSQLEIGSVYTRLQLRELFTINDATLNTGIFRPKGTESVWLFVTDEKTADRVQYKDHLDGDVLLMQGQTEGRTDHLITNQAVNGLELLVFYRTKKYEHDGAGFRYLGPFDFIRSFGRGPASFVLTRAPKRSFAHGKHTWRWALDAVRQLGGSATRAQVEDFIVAKVPEFKATNVAPDLLMLTINAYGRGNWPKNQVARRTDGWHPYDALFRTETIHDGVYTLYDPSVHGVWELAPDPAGVMRPRPVEYISELVAAERTAEDDKAFNAMSEDDGRHKVLASIVRRRGQPRFRRELLAAYGERCAVTECSVTEILEGAHIKPYMGDHTNHVANGLLLRADIHTLFDLRLLRINPVNWVVEVAPRAQADYGKYHGRPLRLPSEKKHSPDVDAISRHFDLCREAFLP